MYCSNVSIDEEKFHGQMRSGNNSLQSVYGGTTEQNIVRGVGINQQVPDVDSLAEIIITKGDE